MLFIAVLKQYVSFGLNYEDVDHIIFDSNYAFEDRIKDEIIHHINQVINCVNIRPQDLDHLLSSSIVALDKEVREFTLNDDEVREISVVVDCFNKFSPMVLILSLLLRSTYQVIVIHWNTSPAITTLKSH